MRRNGEKMARIPEEFVAEVSSRLDIAEVVGAYVSLKKQGRNLTGLCPFHNEKTPSFSVSPDKRIFYCFGCHKGGNALRFLMEIEGLTFPEAVEKAAGMVGLEMPREQASPEENAEMQRRRRYFKLMADAAEFYRKALWSNAGREARAYLERRGIPAELAQRFGLGLSDGWEGAVMPLLKSGYQTAELEAGGICSRRERGDGFFDKFHHRLIFPIFDYRGQPIAFGGRIMGDGQPNQPKYLNSPETRYFHKSQNLYGLFQAASAIRRADEAVLMEGYMDVLAAHQFGVDNAVASLGTAFNIEHARLLRRYTTRVLLVYDGDSAGRNAADKAIDILHDAGFEVRLLTLPGGLDPDEFLRKYGKAAWDRLADNEAADFWRYKLNKALAANDCGTVAGKVAVVKELKPYLNACEDAVELEGVISLLGRAIGISSETIYAELKPKTKLDKLTRPAQTAQSRTPAAEGGAGLSRAQTNLLYFMLCDRDIYERALSELGEKFVESPALQELLNLVQNIKDKYNWRPEELFSYLPEGEAYQLLLRMTQAEVDKAKMPELADGCIRAVRISRLQRRLGELNQQLATAEPKKSVELLREIAAVELEIRGLRN